MSYKHFNTYEKGNVKIFKKLGHSNRFIGETLRRHHVRMRRKIKRDQRMNKYEAKEKQDLYIHRRYQRLSKEKWPPDLVKHIDSKLQAI